MKTQLQNDIIKQSLVRQMTTNHTGNDEVENKKETKTVRIKERPLIRSFCFNKIGFTQFRQFINIGKAETSRD